MPVDPQLQPFLDAGAALPPFDALSVEEARARLRVYPLPGARADAVASVVDRGIPGPGGPLGLRVHTPLGEPLGVVAQRVALRGDHQRRGQPAQVGGVHG